MGVNGSTLSAMANAIIADGRMRICMKGEPMSELEIMEALIAIIILVCTVCYGLLFGITDVMKHEFDSLRHDINTLEYFIETVDEKVEDLIDGQDERLNQQK